MIFNNGNKMKERKKARTGGAPVNDQPVVVKLLSRGVMNIAPCLCRVTFFLFPLTGTDSLSRSQIDL